MRTAIGARIIWDATYDPGTIDAVVISTTEGNDEAIDPRELAPWLAVATGPDGKEHAVLSDGLRHIRLDLNHGSLQRPGPVLLHYHLEGLTGAERRVLPLRRFLYLCRHHRFSRSLFPADAKVRRGMLLLQVHDGILAGASQREIAGTLVGERRADDEWRSGAESLRSRVRRLVAAARSMARGEYRSLMRPDAAR